VQALVSVIIPSYNSAAYLRLALQSVLRQSYTSLQAIVVDDGSTDASQQVIHQLADPRLLYVHQNNRGVAAARNTGIRLAQGEYLAFLDADDEWDPAFLDECVSVIRRKGRAISGAYTSYVYVDDAGSVLPQPGAPVVPGRDLYAQLVRENILLIHSVVLRSDVARAVGGFDVMLPAQEDWDFWLRVTRRHILQGLPHALARYRVRPNSRSFDACKMHESRMRVVAKHFGPLRDHGVGCPRAKREAYAYGYRAAALDMIRDGHRDDAWRLLASAVDVLPELLERVDTFYELAVGDQPRGWRGQADCMDLDANGTDMLARLDGLVAGASQPVRQRRSKAFGRAHLALSMLHQHAHGWNAARRHLVLAIGADPWLVASRGALGRLVKMKATNWLGQVSPARARLATGLWHSALPVMSGLLALYVLFHRAALRSLLTALLSGEYSAGYVALHDLVPARSLADALVVLVLLAGSLLAAWYVADRIDLADYERPLGFGLTALAFVAVPAAVIGGIAAWSGTALLRPPSGPLLSAIPSVAVVAAGVRHGWRPHRLAWPPLGRASPLVRIVWGLALVLLLASCALSLTHPPTGYDALAYHAPLAASLWRDGNIGAFLDRNPDAWPLAQPGTAELWFGLLLLAGGERVADLGQLPFALMGSMAVRAFARRLGLGAAAALLAGGAFLLAPLVIVQSGLQLNDLTGAAILMASLALACAPMERWTLDRLVLLGLGLGLATATKLALLPPVTSVGLVALAAVFHRHSRDAGRYSYLRRMAAVALAFTIVVTPWWVRNAARYGNPIFPAAVPLVGRGMSQTDTWTVPLDGLFVARRAYWAIYPLLEPHNDQSGFGALMVAGAIPGLAFAVVRNRYRRPIVVYLFAAVVTLPAWWVLTRHEPRFLLALVGLSFAFLPWSLLAVPRRWRSVAGGVLATAAVVSAAVTFATAYAPSYVGPLGAGVGQPTTRWEFYDRVWDVDPAIASLPESDGLVLTGYSYTAYYPLLGDWLGRLVLVENANAPVDSIVSRMRDAGVRYAYVSASVESQAAAEASFDATRFSLEHVSTGVEDGHHVRRYLFRLKQAPEY
jgi:glycosyltransferase involved in cell wall biosynthesis